MPLIEPIPKTVPVRASSADQKLVTEWSARVRRGMTFRNRIYNEMDIARYSGYLRCKFPATDPKDYDPNSGMPVQVLRDNVVADEVRRLLPKLNFGVPSIRINPIGDTPIIYAKVKERLINGVLAMIGFDRTLNYANLSATQFGTGFLKLVYDAEYVPSYDQLFNLGFSDGAADKKGNRFEFREDIFPGMPSAVPQHFRNEVFPELCQDFRTARWCAFRYIRPTQDLKNDKRLSNTKDLKPKPMRLSEIDPLIGGGVDEFDIDRSLVEGVTMCTEIRDKETGLMYIFAEDSMKPLFKEEDIFMRVLGGRLPCEAIVFNDNTDYAYGTSDIELVEDYLKELVDVKTQAALDRRFRGLKFAYQRGAIKREELMQLVRGQLGAGIAVDAGNLDSAIKWLQAPPALDLDSTANQIAARIKEHFGSNAFGTFPSSRRGGAEVQGSQCDSGVVVANSRYKAQRATLSIAEAFGNLIEAFWNEDMVVDVLSPVLQKVQDPATGQMIEQDVIQQVWVKFKGKELRGNFDFQMAPASGQHVDLTQRKAEALQEIQLLGGLPGVNHQELIRQHQDVLKTDVMSLFTPANTPQTPMSLNEVQNQASQAEKLNTKPVRLGQAIQGQRKQGVA